MSASHANTIITHAPVATYTAAAISGTVWGLHMSDIAVMVSTLAAVCGAATQVLSYLDRRSPRRRGVETEDDGEAN